MFGTLLQAVNVLLLTWENINRSLRAYTYVFSQKKKVRILRKHGGSILREKDGGI